MFQRSNKIESSLAERKEWNKTIDIKSIKHKQIL